MLRRLFTVLSAACLLMWVATVVVWARSHFLVELVESTIERPHPTAGVIRTLNSIRSYRGSIAFAHGTVIDPTEDRSARGIRPIRYRRGGVDPDQSGGPSLPPDTFWRQLGFGFRSASHSIPGLGVAMHAWSVSIPY